MTSDAFQTFYIPKVHTVPLSDGTPDVAPVLVPLRQALCRIARFERVACRFFGLHLSAWFSRWSERRRARELRALLHGIREHQDGFHIIAGDFDALAPGEELQVGRLPRLDYVFVPVRDASRVRRCEIVTSPSESRSASDHFPLLAEVSNEDVA